MHEENDWYVILDGTYDAVHDFAKIEFSSLTRKVIYRLQRQPATGIYGGDYIYKTVWDEYCHEVQEGPHELLEWAWDQDLKPYLDNVINRVPQHIAVLLTIYAVFELNESESDQAELVGSVDPDGMKTVLRKQLDQEAVNRSLDHLGPWRDM